MSVDANDILRARGPDGLRLAFDAAWAAAEAAGAGRSNGAAVDDRVTATPFRWIDPSRIPPRQWLYDRHYIRKFLTATVSGSGVGKSSHALLDAVSMASGRNLLTGAAIRPVRVWYWNGEDPQEELQRRIAAIALRYGLTEADLAGRLFIDNGRDTQIKVAIDDRQRGITINRPDVDSVMETLQRHAIDACLFDPFVSIHAVPESDNGAIDIVAKALAGVADLCDCAIETIHHVRKGNGAELTVEDARGASSLIGAARSVRVLNPMTVGEATKADINQNERRLYFRRSPIPEDRIHGNDNCRIAAAGERGELRPDLVETRHGQGERLETDRRRGIDPSFVHECPVCGFPLVPQRPAVLCIDPAKCGNDQRGRGRRCPFCRTWSFIRRVAGRSSSTRTSHDSLA